MNYGAIKYKWIFSVKTAIFLTFSRLFACTLSTTWWFMKVYTSFLLRRMSCAVSFGQTTFFTADDIFVVQDGRNNKHVTLYKPSLIDINLIIPLWIFKSPFSVKCKCVQRFYFNIYSLSELVSAKQKCVLHTDTILSDMICKWLM